MKKYLLFIYGDCQNTDFCQYVIDTVSEITHSEVVRFKIELGSMFLHFGSAYEFNQLAVTLQSAFKDRATSHFLVEFNDKTSISMDKHDLECFLSLNVSEPEKKITNKLNDDFLKLQTELLLNELLGGIQFTDFDPLLDEDDDDFETYKKPVNKHKTYNLDDILDKVRNHGRASLTKEEQEFLKTI